jgi:hypothetical protein
MVEIRVALARESAKLGVLKPKIHLVVAIAVSVSGFNNFVPGRLGGGCYGGRHDSG